MNYPLLYRYFTIPFVKSGWSELRARLGGELGQHLLGERLGDVTHMCPECGSPPRPTCGLCLGVGEVSTAALERWQRQLWDGVQT